MKALSRVCSNTELLAEALRKSPCDGPKGENAGKNLSYKPGTKVSLSEYKLHLFCNLRPRYLCMQSKSKICLQASVIFFQDISEQANSNGEEGDSYSIFNGTHEGIGFRPPTKEPPILWR